MEERLEREGKDGEGGDDDHHDDGMVEQQFKHLQQYWGSLQSTNPRSILGGCSSDGKKSVYLLKNSPSELMSPLQRRTAPLSSGVWKVRTNDLAVEEILRERRAAIESGKVKGRRLFWGMEGATEMDLGYSDWSDLVDQDSGAKSASTVSRGSSGSVDAEESDNGGCKCWRCSMPEVDDDDDTERNKMVVVKPNVEEKRSGDNGKRCRALKVCFAIALVVITLGHFLSTFFEEDEVFLVPT